MWMLTIFFIWPALYVQGLVVLYHTFPLIVPKRRLLLWSVYEHASVPFSLTFV